MLKKTVATAFWAVLMTLQASALERVLIEAERFDVPGGWKVDAQFVESMGSPYLIAHGLGVPVTDASTSAAFPSTGSYHVWVRTRNWVPAYSGDAAPGRFQLIVGGTVLPQILGAESGAAGGAWHWQSAGAVDIGALEATVALRDLTGFNGRCDAVAFISGSDQPPPNDSSLAAWRLSALGESLTPAVSESFDCVIVGAGLGGCGAALAAARSGLRVALVQDRPVLGGNASEEIRVATRGEMRYAIVDEIDTTPYTNRDDRTAAADVTRLSVIEAESNITLFMPWRAYAAATNAVRRITHVDIQKVNSPQRKRLQAPLFVDATGDGWIGYWAGADFRQGREANSEFNESRAPAAADLKTMGNSLMWKSRDTGSPSEFPTDLPWAQAVAGARADTGGEWNWEYGISLDTIYDAEEIRDHLLRAIYGNFANAKKNSANANRALSWVPYVAGKRESRRLMGDYILSQNDLEQGVYFEDAVITTDWGIDLHYETSVSYLSTYSKGAPIAKPAYVPYRCFYSRNIPNLFMAGRNFSTTHVGIGSPRVMNTIGQMGVVVGYAAAICIQHDLEPRDVYRIKEHTDDLQARLAGNFISSSASWPERPPPAGSGVILDNSDAAPAVRIFGEWSVSSSDPGYYGANYLHDGNSGKGRKRVAYLPALTPHATYAISVRTPASANKATNIPVWVFTKAQSSAAALSGRGYVRNSQPETNNSGGEILVGRAAANDYMRALLQFDLASVPSNAVIASAVLTLQIGTRDATSSAYVGAEGLRLYQLTQSFAPGQATWSSRSAAEAWSTAGGTFDSTPVGVISAPTDPDAVTPGEIFVFPAGETLLGAVQGAVTAGESLGLIVRTPSLESSYAVRKLYRFSAATLEIRCYAPQLPADALINATAGAGQWKSLGSYESPPEGLCVIIGNDGTTAHAVVDALRFDNIAGVVEGDYDGDGLPDLWERYYFLSETGASPSEDSDGDSRSNRLEYLTGTDPQDSGSRYEMLLGLGQQPERMILNWPSFSNLTYRIESSADLKTFAPVAEAVPATPPRNSYAVMRTQTKEFFRVVLEMP